MGVNDAESSDSRDGGTAVENFVESIVTPLVSKDPGDEGDLDPEDTLAGVEVPKWSEQITFRGITVSIILGFIMCTITHKLNFTTGLIPSLNVGAGLLGFFFMKTWTTTLSKLGIWSKPFTRQENTVIQTAVVACIELAFSGGFGSYLAAMNEKTYKLVGEDYPGNNAVDVKNPSLGWMIAFLFTVSFVGLLVLVPLRKVMLIDYRLVYPSGTATAFLINSFHTTQGAETARKQVGCLGKYFSISFFWSFFKWFFSGIGDSCGFDNFPTFGLTAFNNRIYFDFSLTYVGVGMICSHIVNASVLFGGLLSWGLMWPLIATKEGDWYPDGLGDTDFKGLYSFKVFIAVALVLGDGVYNLLKIGTVSGIALYTHYQTPMELPLTAGAIASGEDTPDEKRRKEAFFSEGVPTWIALSGYVALVAISTALLPHIFPAMRWYFVLLCYVAAPILGFCNAYGDGLTDWSLGTTYGKLGIFIFAAWAGTDGGVMAGLVACGVLMSIVSAAADLMQDFKTGYLTLSSPLSMFVSQVLGTLVGCFMAPLTFWMFWTAFDLGSPTGEYKVPNAVVFREMAILGVEGLSALPDHCLVFCVVFFILAVGLNLFRDLGPKKYAFYVPVPMAMAIPFYIGAYFAIDMFIGTVIRFVWEMINKKDADVYAGVLASGLICGEGIWVIPSAVLSLSRINPPICMSFLPSADAAKGVP